MNSIDNPAVEPKSAAGLKTGDTDLEGSVGQQVEIQSRDTIQYRTCSWQKTAALLFSEYICIAIMSFPWSFSILGLVPGLLLTVGVALIVLYTSLTIWKFCLRNPQVRDVCDIGKCLFWDSDIAWYITAFMFLLNNTFIQGLHCLVGAEYLNTMTDHAMCTIAFALITAIVSFLFSLPRTFSALSKVATFSAAFTFLSLLLAMVFAGIEDHPFSWSPEKGEPVVILIPERGTTFVQGVSAFLNICFTFIGQITLPSFIAEMKEPNDFWKSVTVVTVAEVILFSLVGTIIYVNVGNQYITSPAFGSLSSDVYMKVSYSFMVPTLIFLGVLYASVSARFIFFRMFEGTRHKGNHTIVGWATWSGILMILWVLAWAIAEVIPFFSSLLSIMGAVFGSFFGFIFWGTAYLRMRHADHGAQFYKSQGVRGWLGSIFNVGLILAGLFLLGPGTYTSILSVVQSYQAGDIGGAFACASNALR
ncbi:transmembrane amino acid transporter protein-domain-containing protein [Aspergillus ambiguus]|uniref:transmembrane amino acid transporter protein-domain-containing protein n=1 Tax=Aspergillus ambiguus TaxID=176160 RepID=UPI003CCCE85A